MHKLFFNTLIITLVLSLTYFSSSSFGLTPQEMDAEYEKVKLAAQNQNWNLAKTIATPLAEKGHAKSQVAMGNFYLKGLGVSENGKEALKWYTLAAKQGQVLAQYTVGVIYASGEIIPENFPEAKRWLELAAKQGEAKANQFLVRLKKEEQRRKSPTGLGIFEDNDRVLQERMKRLAEQKKRRAEEERLAEEKRRTDEKQRAEEERLAEEKRISDLKAAEEQRIVEAKEVKRKASEEKRLIEKVKSGKSGDQQVKFIEVVSSAIVKYKKAKNEIKKSVIRKKRAEALKSLFGLNHDDFTYRKPTFDEQQSALSECNAKLEDSIGLAVNLGINFNMQREIKRCEDSSKISVRVNVAGISNKSLFWNGVIKSMDTDKNGNATVIIELHDNILIKNATNSITPHSPIYEVLGEFEEGEKVIFNGSFVLHDNKKTTGYFLKTTNITEKGSLTDPEFDFTFTDFMK